MGQKNNVMLEYLKDSRRFADVFNGYFGGGEQIIDAVYLRDVSDKLNGSLAKNPKTGDRSREIERIRDIKKIYRDGPILQLLCLEDQDYVDYTAAVRTLTMDALEYSQQLDLLKKKHKAENDLKIGDEIECGISRKDRLHPVITLWWYHGSSEYDGPICLKDSLELNGAIPDMYISDYRMNVLTSTADYDDSRFHTEFRELYRTLARKNDKIALKELFDNDERFQSIDADTLRVISVTTDRPSLWNKREKAKGKNGGYVMCKAMDEIEADAMKVGEKRGIDKGIDMRDTEKITDMLRRGKTVDEIVDFCNYPYEQVRGIADAMEA